MITSTKNKLIALILSVATLGYSAPRRPALNQTQMERIAFIANKITWVNPRLDESKAMEYAVGIYRAALKYKIDPNILIAIAQQETNFRDDLPEGAAGEIGICQIRKMWLKNKHFIREFRHQSIKDLKKSQKNFMFAAWILKDLRDSNPKGSLPWWSFYNAVRFEPRFKYFLAVNRNIATINRYELEEEDKDIIQVNELNAQEFWQPAIEHQEAPVVRKQVRNDNLPQPVIRKTEEVAAAGGAEVTGRWLPEAFKSVQREQRMQESYEQPSKKRGVSPAIMRAAAELEVSDLLQGIIQD